MLRDTIDSGTRDAVYLLQAAQVLCEKDWAYQPDNRRGYVTLVSAKAHLLRPFVPQAKVKE